jgi:hypothetical protein
MGPLRSFQLHLRRHHMAFRALLPEQGCLFLRSAMVLTGLCGVIVGSLRPSRIWHSRMIWDGNEPPQRADWTRSATVRSVLDHHT